ncbi:putative rtn protein [Salmonella enterica subsp. enterica]|uniref:Putative rtn protein n=1 Tax=Salmonella enterica I TaxID=59201 RepID=A0A3S4I3N4_SALET|nr:putative rtn protein [Salmonella enterica subsp. enterica]
MSVTLGFWKMAISLAPLSPEPNAIIFPGWQGFLYLLLIRKRWLRSIGSMAEGPDRLVVVYVKKVAANKAAFVIVDFAVCPGAHGDIGCRESISL